MVIVLKKLRAESMLFFWGCRRGYVGFGLGAVKGVGDVAAEAIVVEREKNGPYKSIFEFCSR